MRHGNWAIFGRPLCAHSALPAEQTGPDPGFGPADEKKHLVGTDCPAEGLLLQVPPGEERVARAYSWHRGQPTTKRSLSFQIFSHAPKEAEYLIRPCGGRRGKKTRKNLLSRLSPKKTPKKRKKGKKIIFLLHDSRRARGEGNQISSSKQSPKLPGSF